MTGLKKEYVIYGLNNYKEIIDEIIEELDAGQHDFDLRLILTESISNAFRHGNKLDGTKPIYVRYLYDGRTVQFEIQDSSDCDYDVSIPDELDDGQLLNEIGRGLYLINCLADCVSFANHTCTIRKKLN